MIESEPLFAGVEPFFRVAEARSFRAAAAALGVSTAAVSKAVKRLEERVGVKLLVRTSRSVTLTAEGAIYLERCREAVSAMLSARSQLSQSRRQPSGELRVSASFILGPVLVPELPQLAQRYPKLSLRLSFTDRVSRLVEENLDVALRVGARESSSLLSRLLLGTRWVTVASPVYVARHGSPIIPADLKRLSCVRFVQPNGKPRDFTFRDPDTSRELQQPVNGNLALDNGAHLLDAAHAGQGVVQVLDFMVRPALANGTLVELLPSYAAPGPDIHAVMAPERSKSANVRALLELLAEVFGRLARQRAR
jgi:LysR family transcriptional regulator, regulator for bpeEF and oprC